MTPEDDSIPDVPIPDDSMLDDEEYEAFLAREFDRDGNLRDAPRVGWYIGFAVVLLVAVALMLFL